jgi:phosphoribosylanthranilate isomerase
LQSLQAHPLLVLFLQCRVVRELCRTSTILLVDHVKEKELEILREQLPGIKLVQVLHVTGEESIEEAVSVSSFVDAILLDSGNQSLEVKELGGTGRTHDWSLSKRIRQSISVPLFLAGGLNADNVVEAIRSVEPFGLDLCSGVRTDDKLDSNKLNQFFDNIRHF